MKRTKTHILLCILLCLSLVSADALPLFASSLTQASLSTQQANRAVNKNVNGEYVVSVCIDGKWQEAGRIGYDMFLKENSLDLSGYLAENSSTAVRIIQEGGEAAQLDSIFLGGETPQSVDCDDGIYLMKLSKKDLDLINVAPEGVELVFPANRHDDILSVTGRIEGENTSKEPFKFPSSNNYKPITKSSEFYTYKLGSINKELSLDGRPLEVADQEPLFKTFCTPGTGHPEGYTYGWVMNDDTYLYAVVDFTSDNSMDGDKDYSKLYVKTKGSVKEFKVSVPETAWGLAGFAYTDKVNYQHKVYEFKIPLEEIGVSGDSSIELAFSAYGTAAMYPRIHPDIAYNSNSRSYLVVYEDLGENNISGRFADENAYWLPGEAFQISEAEESHKYPITPVAAYDSVNDKFLVAWVERQDEGEFSVMGRFLDGFGNPEGNAFLIYTLENGDWGIPNNLSITYNNTSSEFLVVWDDYAQGFGDSAMNIYGRIIDYNLTPKMSDVIEISVATGDQVSPSVAYSESDDCYLAIWENLLEGNDGNDINGCLFKKSAILKNDIQINSKVDSNPDTIRKNPSVTYDSNLHQFVAAWADSRSSSGDPTTYDLYSSRLDLDASRTIPGSESMLSSGYEFDDVSLEYNSHWNTMSAVWSDQPSVHYLLTNDVYDGELGYGGRLMNATESYSANPAIAANSNSESFVAAFSSPGYEQYGQAEVFLYLIGDYTNRTPKLTLNPAVAYNADENNYLLVYSNHEYLIPTRLGTEDTENPTGESIYSDDLGILGQFISKDAAPLDDPFLISASGGNNYYGDIKDYPDIAYGDEMFLVVWAERTEDTVSYMPVMNIMGNFLDKEGESYTDGPFTIAGNVDYDGEYLFENNLTVAYGENGRFLVVYSDGEDILGRKVELDDADNNEAIVSKADIEICSNENNQSAPSVSYSTDAHRFLVVWQDSRDDGGSGNLGSNLYGRLLDEGGAVIDPTGEDLSICTSGKHQGGPSVSYNSRSGKFTVTWYQVDNDNEEDSIWGKHFNTDGSPVENVEKLIISSPDNATPQEYRNLSTVYNPTSLDEYFSVWSTLDYGEYATFGMGQHVSKELVASGSRYEFGEGVYNEDRDKLDIACNTTEGNYLVTYPCVNELDYDNYSSKNLKENKAYTEYGGYIKWELIGDAAPAEPDKIQFKETSAGIAEYSAVEGQTVNVLVERTGDAAGIATAKYTISGGTSTAEDYEITGDTVTFADGDTAVKAISIKLKNDATDENEEFLTLSLYECNGADPGNIMTSKIYIQDNDIPELPYFSFTNTTYTVAENVYSGNGEGFAEITVKFVKPLPIQVTSLMDNDQTVVSWVYYKTGDGTARVSDGDYTKAEGKLTFTQLDFDEEKGYYVGSFMVPILDDTKDESDETVILTLSEPSEGTRLVNIPCTATLTITDNDNTPKPPSGSKDKDKKSTPAAVAPPVVIEAPPPTEGLPDDALVGRMPGYITLGKPAKINEVKDVITLSYNNSTLTGNPGHDARIYYWQPTVEKWVALATYPDGDGRVKAINDGGYMGWFVVFGVVQPHFSDVSSSWAEQLINRMNGLGLVEGYNIKGSDLRIAKPEQKVTRAEFTMFVARIMNMNPDNVLLPGITDSETESILSQSYTDAADIAPWARAAVAKATKAGLVPFKGSSFKPLEPITRIEAGVMVSRALKKLKDFKVIDLTSFKDSPDIPGWAVGEVVENALEGYPDNTLKPNADIARAESLSMLLRLFIKGLGW